MIARLSCLLYTSLPAFVRCFSNRVCARMRPSSSFALSPTPTTSYTNTLYLATTQALHLVQTSSIPFLVQQIRSQAGTGHRCSGPVQLWTSKQSGGSRTAEGKPDPTVTRQHSYSASDLDTLLTIYLSVYPKVESPFLACGDARFLESVCTKQ